MQLTIKRREIIPIIFQKDAQGKFIPFDLVYCTYNEATQTGGRITTYKSCVVLKDDYPQETKDLVPQKTVKNSHTESPQVYKDKKITIKLPNGSIKKLWFKFILGINHYQIQP